MPDFHPLIVHFPIALLTLYGVFELISIRRLQEKHYWFYIKAVLVILGAVSGAAALLMALLSKGISGEGLIGLHERFSYASVALSIFIAILYSMAWFGGPRALLHTSKFLFNRGVMIPLALATLIVIFITGGLGGALVYGTDFDPLMKPVFKFLDVY